MERGLRGCDVLFASFPFQDSPLENPNRFPSRFLGFQPELHQLLCEEDGTTVSIPYTAAVLEYCVHFHDPTVASQLDKSLSMENGHSSVHDAQHPCRANVAVKKGLYTPASDRSCTHLEFDIAGTGLV
ncbi:MFS transporter multidrug-resistance type transporter [Sarracenia purpurea var. burkii]